MHIIIDGYNVIGILHNDIEKARNSFVELLIKYKKLKHHDITVIFDAYKSGDRCEQTLWSGGIKIIYTRLGQTADELIKSIISNERREWVVITSDRDLIRHAWSVNSVPVRSDIFFNVLLRDAPSQKLDYVDIEDITEIKPVKGNPYRLSRKKKAIKRVMDKF